jgi:hypothetical protein
MLTLSASGAGAATLAPAQAAERYALVLERMVEAAESVHDTASARGAMRAFGDATRERLSQEAAIEAMPVAAQAEYERLVAARRSEIEAKRARLDAALARMMATPAFVLTLADAS